MYLPHIQLPCVLKQRLDASSWNCCTLPVKEGHCWVIGPRMRRMLMLNIFCLVCYGALKPCVPAASLKLCDNKRGGPHSHYMAAVAEQASSHPSGGPCSIEVINPKLLARFTQHEFPLGVFLCFFCSKQVQYQVTFWWMFLFLRDSQRFLLKQRLIGVCSLPAVRPRRKKTKQSSSQQKPSKSRKHRTGTNNPAHIHELV